MKPRRPCCQHCRGERAAARPIVTLGAVKAYRYYDLILGAYALKRAEREDYYDRNTDFTPFSLRA